MLVVSHTKTGGTQAMTEAVVAGASHPDIDGVEVVQAAALEATADDVMAADGYLLGTPENFGYMSGAMKHFFDTVYYGCLDHTGAGLMGSSYGPAMTAPARCGQWIPWSPGWGGKQWLRRYWPWAS